MRRLNFQLTVALITMASPLPAFAQPQPPEYYPSGWLSGEQALQPPPLGGQNAAFEYFKAWDMLTLKQRRDLAEVAGAVDSEHKLDKAAIQKCAENRAYIDALIRVANMEQCDWGIRRSDGFGALLPYLGLLRGNYRVIRMDARRCAEESNPVGAAERIAAMLNMPNHLSGDGFLISSLVGIAINAGALDNINVMLKNNELTVPAARVLLAALHNIPKEDLFGMTAAVKREGEMGIAWVRSHCTGPDAGARFATEVYGFSDPGALWTCVLLAGMDERRLSVQVDRAELYHAAVDKLWKEPIDVVRLRELEWEVAEWQYGLVASLIAPSISRAAQTLIRERASINKSIAKLEAFIAERQAEGDGPPSLPQRP